jgi:hypothetical protein
MNKPISEKSFKELKLRAKGIRIGIISKITHSVAQNLMIQGKKEFKMIDALPWIDLYDEALDTLELNIDDYGFIINEVHETIENEFNALKNGSIKTFGGSQIKPEFLLREDVITLNGFRELIENHEKELAEKTTSEDTIKPRT